MAYFAHSEHTDTYSDFRFDWNYETPAVNALEGISPTPEVLILPPQPLYASPADIILEICTLMIAIGNILGFIQSKQKK